MAVNINNGRIEVSVEAIEKAGVSRKMVNDCIEEMLPMALLEACNHDKEILMSVIEKAGKKFIKFQCEHGDWSSSFDQMRLRLATSIASSNIHSSLFEKIEELDAKNAKASSSSNGSGEKSEAGSDDEGEHISSMLALFSLITELGRAVKSAKDK